MVDKCCTNEAYDGEKNTVEAICTADDISHKKPANKPSIAAFISSSPKERITTAGIIKKHLAP